mmetsp:Transcript_4139/g.7139  ORF Transcript_4139/g.7139 Transcript_4139/m.7139 type:complete len:97 (+) Transcript_4139:138-428(+)
MVLDPTKSIEPESEAYSNVITSLSKRFGTEPFEPHVTLLSLFEATEETAQEFAKELKDYASGFVEKTQDKSNKPPGEIRFETGKPTAGERFFQVCE